MDLMIYGLQRSGTNYTEALILENFKHTSFWNEHYPKSLPTHKHFRLYEQKHLVPSLYYLNEFYYPTFQSFDAHVSGLTKKKDLKYVVVVKDPYGWYLSYLRYAHRTTEINFLKKDANGQFILEWNLFYGKWLQFQQEAPDRVHIIRYKDLLKDLGPSLERIEDRFGMTRKAKEWHNPKAVGMSKKFNFKRKKYYTEGSYLEEFDPKHFRVISEMIDPVVCEKLQFERLESETTFHLQNNYQPKT